MASDKYPQSSTKEAIIKGLADVDARIFHMGTTFKDGNYVTDGGRVLLVMAKGNTLEEAYDKVYKDVHKIDCDKLFYRSDIGKKDMEE